MIPFIFPDAPGDYLPKWIFYFAMSIITETANTFTGIARSGFGSTITPEPLERSRLIATANFMSHFVEDVPKQIFGIRYHGLPEGADASFFLCKELKKVILTA